MYTEVWGGYGDCLPRQSIPSLHPIRKEKEKCPVILDGIELAGYSH